MRDLNEMTLGQRIALTFIIVLVILFAMAIAGFISGRWEEAPAAPLLASPFDQHFAELEHEALDEAYKSRVHRLFEIWLSDSHDQPRRALVGIANARTAYTEAMTEVQKRERQ
jgi:hypothetical protein